MKGHKNASKEMLRYVYMLDVDNRGQKSRYFGHKKVLYTGQTMNIIRRAKDHLHKIGSKFLKSNFGDARKRLVFIEYVFGTEYDAIALENEFKKCSRERKLEIIDSPQNKLIKYMPFKAIILKKYKNETEQVCLLWDSDKPHTCPVGSDK